MSEKSKFVEMMKTELSEWEAKIDQLKVDAALSKMEARDDIDSVKQALRAKVRPLRAKLKELSEETDEAWDDLAGGFSNAWTDVKTAIKDAASKYRS